MGLYGLNLFSIEELMISPFYLILIYIFAWLYRKKFEGQSMQIYFMPALHLRIIGCVLSIMMYQYYYQGGDMFAYLWGASLMNEIFWEDFGIGLDFMTCQPDTIPGEVSYRYSSYVFRHYSSLLVCQIGGFLSIFTFGSYLTVSLLLAFLSFLGCWKIYEVFQELFPSQERGLAYAILFIPSVFFWGSAGLMKDTVTLAALGYLTWSTYHIFIKRKHLVKSLIYVGISLFILFSIKIYIAIAFLPAIASWIILTYQKKIKSESTRTIMKPILVIGAIIISMILLQLVSQEGGKYSIDNVIEYSMVMQQDHYYRAGGSVYSLGKIDPSLLGIIQVIPAAINVTLFRPYIWEATSPFHFLSAFEGLVTFIITIYVFIKVGIIKTLVTIIKEPTVLFCLIFALVFSFAVGLSAYNFGA